MFQPRTVVLEVPVLYSRGGDRNERQARQHRGADADAVEAHAHATPVSMLTVFLYAIHSSINNALPLLLNRIQPSAGTHSLSCISRHFRWLPLPLCLLSQLRLKQKTTVPRLSTYLVTTNAATNLCQFNPIRLLCTLEHVSTVNSSSTSSHQTVASPDETHTPPSLAAPPLTGCSPDFGA